MADDFTNIESGIFDTIIVNSVIQYFPSIDYLFRVLEGAVKIIAPGGSIFIGDIRSLPLLEAFHTSVQLCLADDSLSIYELRQRIQKRIIQEQELVIDPCFFIALKQYLPRISDVQVQLKRGYEDNELSKFRYDVTLQVDTVINTSDESLSLNWGQSLTVDAVCQMLNEQQPDILEIKGVSNARLWSDIQIVELLNNEQVPATVGELRTVLKQKNSIQSIAPEDWYKLGDHCLIK
jgi:hypothetical protein